MKDRKEYEMGLWKRWKETGDVNFRNELLDSMEPLIKQNVNKYRSAPIPTYALESAAREMVAESFDTYDPSKAQLNTHAVNNMKHLQRYVIKYQNVGTIPENRATKITRYRNVKQDFIDKNLREPTLAELADELDWSLKEVERMELEQRNDLNLRENKEDSFFDFTFEEDDSLKDAAHFVWFDEDPKGKKIIEHTFGLNSKPKLTTKELAKDLNMSEPAVRKKARDIGSKINDVRYSI